MIILLCDKIIWLSAFLFQKKKNPTVWLLIVNCVTPVRVQGMVICIPFLNTVYKRKKYVRDKQTSSPIASHLLCINKIQFDLL